jgi:rhomboid protease GluP
VTDSPAVQPRRVSFMLPLHKPIATWVLLGIIGVVFVVETLLGGSTDVNVLVFMGAKVNVLVAIGQYWRLFTSMFLHIGLLHLFFNGYALLVIGTEIERILGWKRFLTIYFSSGLFGGLASYAFSPNVSAGASGAIFGLIGALAAFFALHRQQLGSWGRKRLGNIAFLIAINLFFGFTQPGIDNWAHMGGLLSGFGLGWAMAPRYVADPFQLRLTDRNQLRRYWPAIALALVILVSGTALATFAYRNRPQSQLELGFYAIEHEAWSEAADELGQAVARDPSIADASAYFHLGLARSHLEQPELAAVAYESALSLAPNDSASHWNLALTYLQLGRYTQARSHFETYLELNPGDAAQVQRYLDELPAAP